MRKRYANRLPTPWDPAITGSVDVKAVRIARPRQFQRFFYNGKYGHHVIKFQVSFRFFTHSTQNCTTHNTTTHKTHITQLNMMMLFANNTQQVLAMLLAVLKYSITLTPPSM